MGYNNNMTKHIKYIINGARQILVLMPNDNYVLPSKSDFFDDVKTLRKDVNRVAMDLKKTIKKHDK